LSCNENQIVFVPYNQAIEAQWHLYDCGTKTIISYPKPPGTLAFYAYATGVYDPTNNQVIFVPRSQAPQDQWHTLQHFGASQISPQLAAHYLFNKY
jgi:hypothetical protein